MPETGLWIARLLDRELEGFVGELALFPDETLVWQTVPGVTNSAGNLTCHVCGNLQHFVGRVLGGTSYVRNRPLEFSARDIATHALIDDLTRTREVVRVTLPALTGQQLLAEYPEQLGGATTTTGLLLIHLVAHTAFHLGQVGYLRRALTGDHRSAGPLPVAALADR